MRCDKCQGCLRVEFDAVSCLNCGKHVYRPDPPPALCMDEARWASVLCAKCHTTPAVIKKEFCPACLKATFQRQGFAHSLVNQQKRQGEMK